METCIRMLVPTPEEFFILDEIENYEPGPNSWPVDEPKVETAGMNMLH